jgi:hypothetical protein
MKMQDAFILNLKRMIPMKKVINGLFVAAACLVSTVTLAAPFELYVTFYCPAVENLSNFGDFVGGPGYERVKDNKVSVLFRSTNAGGFPDSFSNYSHESVTYAGSKANVTCAYTSTKNGEKRLELSYNVLNGKGGQIIDPQSKKDEITVLFIGGLKE